MARRPDEKAAKRPPPKREATTRTKVSPDASTRAPYAETATPDDDELDPDAVTAVNLKPLGSSELAALDDDDLQDARRGGHADRRGSGTAFDLRPGSLPRDDDSEGMPTLVVEGDEPVSADDDDAHPPVSADDDAQGSWTPDVTDPGLAAPRPLGPVTSTGTSPRLRREMQAPAPPPEPSTEGAPRLRTQVVHVPVEDEGPQVVAAAPVAGTSPHALGPAAPVAPMAPDDGAVEEEGYVTKWRDVPAAPPASPASPAPSVPTASPPEVRPPQRLQTVLWGDGEGPRAADAAPADARPRTGLLRLPPEPAQTGASADETAAAIAAIDDAVTLMKAARIHAASLPHEDARGMAASLAGAIQRLEAAIAGLRRKG